MKKFKPCIFGVDGLIGNALWNAFRADHLEIFGTSLRGTEGLPFLDLRNPSLSLIDLSGVTHAIIAGASPNLRNCELNPKDTSACNLFGPLELARQCAARGIQPILFSTECVFDGIEGGYTEDAIPRPLNQYGWQKFELEKRVAEVTSGNYLMLRLNKVFLRQARGAGLIGEIANQLLHGEKIRAATDLIFSPILLDDVVLGVSTLIRKGAKGLYHLAGPEIWSRYALSMEIGRRIGVNLDLIEPITLDDLNEPFKRPKKGDLISDKFEQATELKRRKFSSILEEIIK